MPRNVRPSAALIALLALAGPASAQKPKPFFPYPLKVTALENGLRKAQALADSIARRAPSPIEYPTPKPAEVLEADKAISLFPLPAHPALIEVKEAQGFMEK